jgi:hypothetical protein
MYSSAPNLEASAGICFREITCIGKVMGAPQHSDMNGSRLLYITNSSQCAWISDFVFGYKFHINGSAAKKLIKLLFTFQGTYFYKKMCPIVIILVQCRATKR